MSEFARNLNIPNILTTIRILVIPYFIYCLFIDETFYRITAFSIFIVASLTDFVDGYLARKWNQETEFGKFLDPLADKILVVSSFITFIIIDEQIETWMVLIIILRDMLITSLRYLALSRGRSIRTTVMGKVKTAFQMGAIIILLTIFIVLTSGERKNINFLYEAGRSMGLTAFEIALENFFIFKRAFLLGNLTFELAIKELASFLPYFVMLLTTFITVLSGIRYLVTNAEYLKWKYVVEFFRSTK